MHVQVSTYKESYKGSVYLYDTEAGTPPIITDKDTGITGLA